MKSPNPPKETQKTPKTTPRKSNRLGRGLSALMGQSIQIPPLPASTNDLPAKLPAQSANTVTPGVPAPSHLPHPSLAQPEPQPGYITRTVPIGSITPNHHQPRKQFNEASLQQLAQSIRENGVIQPVIIRETTPKPDDPKAPPYQLVAGERRWRAAKQAGLTEIPVIMRKLDDKQVAQWALIENLQREDLNPIERAEAFQHLCDTFHLSHDQIAKQVGVDRSTISNSLRLLKLNDFSRQYIINGLLSSGQGKAIAGLSDTNQQQLVAQQAVAQGWSVRRVEQEIRRITHHDQANTDPTITAKARTPTGRHLHDLEQQIGQQLQTKVKVRPGRRKGSGTLTIEFYSLDQFDTLMNRFGVQVKID